MLSQTLLSPVSDFSQAQEKEDEGQGLESAGLVVELSGLFLCTSESFHKIFIHIRLQCCHLQTVTNYVFFMLIVLRWWGLGG